jgi:hypothetical protein
MFSLHDELRYMNVLQPTAEISAMAEREALCGGGIVSSWSIPSFLRVRSNAILFRLVEEEI